MTYMEYKEVKIPQDCLDKLDSGEAETLSHAGVFTWLNQLARDEGWRVVWTGFNFPFLILEREVNSNE